MPNVALRLTDDQLAAVLRAAEPHRSAFLQDVAAALQGQESGDGTVYQGGRAGAAALLRPADPVGASAVGMLIPIPEPLGLAELLELAWRNAPPGREAATRNELVREFWRESPPKRGPVAGEREIVSGVRTEIAPEPILPSLSPGGCTQPGAEP